MEALALLKPFAPREPRNVQLASMMGLAALRAGLFDEAEYHARRAVALAPLEAALRSNLAMTLLQRPGAPKAVHMEAMSLLRETLAAIPHHMDALCTLAIMLLDENQPGELLRLCEAAIAYCRSHGMPDPIDPQFSMFHSQVLCIAGRHAEAFAILDAAIARFPGHSGLRLAAAVPLHVMPGLTPGEIARRHKDYGVALCAHTPRVKTHGASPGEEDRPLRIGVMSPDLRRHSVAFFTLPWFEHINRSEFELYVYSIGHTHDDMSDRLAKHAKAWHKMGFAPDGEIIQRILADRVDILIELAGLTSEQRFSVLASKPAPVLATYCGYPDTVGIPTIDYRIVDSHTDPVTLAPGTPAGTPTFDERCVEKLIRLDPCFLCYVPPAGSPEVGVREEGKGFTFASFNSWRKLNPRVVTLWARVLDAVPGSRMLIKCVDMRDDFSRSRVRSMLDSAMAGRYELLEPKTTIEEHLALYTRVDVALDTLPYHGTTTTCEAMFMGVPVVTLEGDTHVSRVGVSLLRNVGVPELIARDDNDFVRVAASLAGDAARRARLRLNLRGMLLASPLCDAEAFTARLSAALRGMWQQACGAKG